MARKKEERAIRAAYKKEKKVQKYMTDDEALANFIIQLNKLGLELRPIPGDGNCLFRALGDQIDGHSRSHLLHRRAVVDYMSEHREDFEPFVEDDVPFDKHVLCLSNPGTYAGNDAIVAFARLHQLTVVIHQLNSPLWEIHGTTKLPCKQIHISYHNGDHYSSVRRLGDNTDQPNSLRVVNGRLVESKDSETVRLKKSSNKRWQNGSEALDSEGGGEAFSDVNEGVGGDLSYSESGMNNGGEESKNSSISNLSLVTGCHDRKLIEDLYLDHGCDFESTATALKLLMSSSSPAGSDMLTNSSSDSDLSSHTSGINNSNATDNAGAAAKAKTKSSNSQKRRERKLEKKARAEERHRKKIQEELHARSNGTGGGAKAVPSSDDSDGDGHTVIINEELKVLQI